MEPEIEIVSSHRSYIVHVVVALILLTLGIIAFFFIKQSAENPAPVAVESGDILTSPTNSDIEEVDEAALIENIETLGELQERVEILDHAPVVFEDGEEKPVSKPSVEEMQAFLEMLDELPIVEET